MKERLEGIQALRGIAALAVVCRHAMTEAGISNWLTVLFGGGVDIFFVISGFIMAHTSGEMSGATFLIRRIARVAPLYWLCTLALVALSASGLAYSSLDISPARVLSSLLFIDPKPVLFVGWSLNYEMLFYLAFAGVLALGLFRWSAVLIALLMVACVASGVPGISRPIVLEFAFGVILGAAHARGLSGRNAQPALLVGVGLLVLTSLVSAQSPGHEIDEQVRWLWWGAPATLLVYAALSWKPRFTLLGDASYSIYLGHVLVMTVLAVVLKRGFAPVWIAAPLAVLASVALGIALYKTVEGPLHRLTSSYFRERRRRQAVLIAAE